MAALNILKGNSEWFLQPWKQSQTNQKQVVWLFFFFFIFVLSIVSLLYYLKSRGQEKSKNKNPTCPIITSHVKPSVFTHLNQILLSFVLCNYNWGYKWRTRAKPWFHICMVPKPKPILYTMFMSKVPLRREKLVFKSIFIKSVGSKARPPGCQSQFCHSSGGWLQASYLTSAPQFLYL